MVNSLYQGIVQLPGTGFRARPNGDYQPGEYKRLTNVEIEDNKLRNRRSIRSVFGNSADATVTPSTNPFGFIGSMGTFAIYSTATEHVAVGPEGRVPMWQPSNLPVPGTANSFHKIVGYFRYNNKNYWITIESSVGVSIKVCLYWGNIVDANDTPSAYGNAYYASLTRTEIITKLATDLDYNKFEGQNFMIHDERLWIATATGLYASEPTNMLNFTAPPGYFIKFPEQKIMHVMGLRNDIYVLCENSVQHITYNDDINVDGQVRRLSANIGGEKGCIHQDTPYFVNNIGIYAINNGYIQKVSDNEFDVGSDYFRNGIAAFGEYLIINKYTEVNYEKFDSLNTKPRVNLVTNPSVETSQTGWGGSSYATISRENVAGYVGTWRAKFTKVNAMFNANHVNNVKNPSFETGIQGWTERTTSPYQPSTFTRINTASHSGAWSGKLVSNANHIYPSVMGLVQTSSYYMTAAPNVDYLAKCRARKAVSTDAFNKVTLTLEFMNAGGTLVDSEAVTITVGTTWDQLRINAKTTNASVTQARVTIGASTTNSAGTVAGQGVLIDSFMFTEDTGDVTYFDGDTPDVGVQYTYDWLSTAGNSVSLEYGQVGDVAAVTMLGYSTATPVSAGVSYTIGGAFWTPGIRNVVLKVSEFNGGTFLQQITVGATKQTAANKWTFLSQAYVPSTNCTQITFNWVGNGKGANAIPYGEVFYSDAAIVETTDTFLGYFDGSTPDTTAIDYGWSGTAHASTSTGIINSVLRRLYQRGRQFIQGAAGNTLGYCCYALNTTNGSVHVIDFVDGRDVADVGFIVEAYVNYYKDSSGNYNCFFLTNRMVSEAPNSWTYAGNVYFMNTTYDPDFYDYAALSTNVLKKYAPKVEIEWDSFAPDVQQYRGMPYPEPFEYMWKRFRTLSMMAKVPISDCKFCFGFDNEPFTIAVDLTTGDPNLSRPHYPYRMPVNQRARSISMKLFNEGFNTPLVGDAIYGQLEVSDLRLLWTHTLHPANRVAPIR